MDIEVENIQTGKPFHGYLYHGSTSSGLKLLKPNNPAYSGGLGHALYLAEQPEAEFYGRHVYRVPVESKRPFVIKDPPSFEDFPFKSFGTTRNAQYAEWDKFGQEYEHPFGDSWTDCKEVPKKFIDTLNSNEKTYLSGDRKSVSDDIEDAIQEKWEDWEPNNIPVLPDTIFVGEQVAPFVFVIDDEVISVISESVAESLVEIVQSKGYDCLVISGIRFNHSRPGNHEVLMFKPLRPDQIDGQAID